MLQKKKKIRIIEKRKNGKECCKNSKIKRPCVTTDDQSETGDSEEEKVDEKVANQDQNADIEKKSDAIIFGDNEEEQVGKEYSIQEEVSEEVQEEVSEELQEKVSEEVLEKVSDEDYEDKEKKQKRVEGKY